MCHQEPLPRTHVHIQDTGYSAVMINKNINCLLLKQQVQHTCDHNVTELAWAKSKNWQDKKYIWKYFKEPSWNDAININKYPRQNGLLHSEDSFKFVFTLNHRVGKVNGNVKVQSKIRVFKFPNMLGLVLNSLIFFPIILGWASIPNNTAQVMLFFTSHFLDSLHVGFANIPYWSWKLDMPWELNKDFGNKELVN